MNCLLHLLAFLCCLISTVSSGHQLKIHEIGSDEQQIDIDELRYFIEPAHVSFDMQSMIKRQVWS